MAESGGAYRSPEEEIRDLERRLEEKKREVGADGRAEKEMFREVLREHVRSAREGAGDEGVTLPSSHRHVVADEVITDPAELRKEEAREDEIRSLVEDALTRGVGHAVRRAAAESPYLLDELHDHLVDDFYDKLVALRKIKEF